MSSAQTQSRHEACRSHDRRPWMPNLSSAICGRASSTVRRPDRRTLTGQERTPNADLAAGVMSAVVVVKAQVMVRRAEETPPAM